MLKNASLQASTVLKVSAMIITALTSSARQQKMHLPKKPQQKGIKNLKTPTDVLFNLGCKWESQE